MDIGKNTLAQPIDIATLNRIAKSSIDETDVSLIFVLYNADKGIEVIPWWESVTPKMLEDAPVLLTRLLIRFAAEAGPSTGTSVGTFVYQEPSQ